MMYFYVCTEYICYIYAVEPQNMLYHRLDTNEALGTVSTTPNVYL